MISACLKSSADTSALVIGLQRRLAGKGVDIPIILSEQDLAQYNYILEYKNEQLVLWERDLNDKSFVTVDFVSGSLNHRRKFGGGKSQAIAKATGLSVRCDLTILDATAGLGRDAFVLATLGARVSMYERNALIAELLNDGIVRANTHCDSELCHIMDRMEFVHGDTNDLLKASMNPLQQWDIIYLDPMFPVSKQKALPKKEMRIFKELVGVDADNDELLRRAIQYARYRVVVKRPIKSEFYHSVKPTYSLNGKVNRFDIYVNKSLNI